MASADEISDNPTTPKLSHAENGRQTPQLTFGTATPQLAPGDKRMELLEARLMGKEGELPSGSAPASAALHAVNAAANSLASRPAEPFIPSDATAPSHLYVALYSLSYHHRTRKDTPERVTRRETKRRRFTKAEDDLIMQGYAMYGSMWDHIVEFAKLDRSGEQARDRHRRLLKKEERTGSDGLKLAPTPMKPRSVVSAGPPSTVDSSALDAGLSSENPLDLDALRTLAMERGNEVNRLRTVLNDSEAAHLKAYQDLEQRYKATLDHERLVINALQDSLTREAMLKRQEKRKLHAQNCEWVGTMVIQRQGADFVEVWRSGRGFRELERDSRRVQERARVLQDGLKRTAEERRVLRRAQGNDSIGNRKWMTARLGDVGTELYKLSKDKLKKEEEAIEERFRCLKIEKALHVRETMRIRDEDTSALRNYPILRNRYLLLHLLGKGGFSEVYMAHDLQEMQSVAVKVHRMSSSWSEEKKASYVRHAIREYGIHKTLQHPNVVECYDVFEIDALSFGTVLEYCSGDDLDMHIKKNGVVPEREARIIIIQIINALHYLSTQVNPIIHYDLKPANILFDLFGVVKITDFGLAKVLEEGAADLELTSQGAGTYYYLPPEVFVVGQGVPRISNKVDVWSVGVIFYQMIFGAKPFGQNIPQPQLLSDKVIFHSTEPNFPLKPSISDGCRDFIRLCMTFNAENRPTVQQLVVHPYLAKKKK